MITIGFSTRKIDSSFIDLLKNSCGIPKVEILPIENNGEYSLTQVYNKIIDQSSNDIIILCHDDIYFDTKNWGNKILNHFKRNHEYGILGVAGSTQLPKSGKWWEDFSKMKGIVNHENGGKKWESKYSVSKGNQLDDVLLVDGLFIVLHRNRIKKMFSNEINGFHFYDVDFSFKNFLSGVKIGVLYDVRITHKSIGQTNDEWEKNRQKFSEEMKSFLPSKIEIKVKDNPYFRVMICGKNFLENKNLINFLVDHKINVSFFGEYDQNPDVKKLENKNVKFYPLDRPYGFMVGDGVWGFNTPQGFVMSEKNKRYKVKEFDYDIIHNTEPEMFESLIELYPNATILNDANMTQNIDDLLNKYYNTIND